MLGQRDGAVLARVTPEGLRCTPEPAGINQKKKKSSLLSLSLSTYMAFSTASHKITNASLPLPAKQPGLA